MPRSSSAVRLVVVLLWGIARISWAEEPPATSSAVGESCPGPSDGSWMPGCVTSQLSALSPEFRGHVEQVLGELREQGHDPRVVATYRSPGRQEFLFQAGQFLESFGSAPFTKARANQSCHNAQGSQGGPAALAVDVVPGPQAVTAEQKAQFYRAMGKVARGHQLKWGGSWARKNKVWKRYGLGWDPAHLQSRRCRR